MAIERETEPEPSSDRQWQIGPSKLNNLVHKQFSTSTVSLEEEDRELDQLWRPNALNLNIPIRNYSSNSIEMTPVSFFRQDSSSKLIVDSGNENGDKASHFLSVPQLTIVFCGFMLVFSLVGIDQTIIVTALPTIASDFNAVSDLSWIASAFFLTEASVVLFFGKILTISPAKMILLGCVAIFELGSLFCAIAPSVDFLIFGRAVAGVGAGGIWISITSILTRISTLKQRPLLMGLLGAVFALCSIFGPLIGGVFADGAFVRIRSGTVYIMTNVNIDINLPVGGVGTAVVIFTLPNLAVVNTETLYFPVSGQNRRTFLQRHRQLNAWFNLDWTGVFLSFASITLVLLGLQAGGNTKPWTDGAVIAPLILGVILFVAFGFWEHYQGSRAIVPITLFLRRNIFGACVQTVLIFWGFRAAVYYLPLLYQLRGHSAEKSGLDILPYMFAGVIISLVGSAIVTITGHIWPLLCFPQILAAVVFGLLSATKQDTSFALLIGYQILLGVGLGACIQNPVLLAQAEFVHDSEAASLASSLVTFCQIMGSAINLAANGAILSGVLRSQISKLAGDLSPDLRAEVLENITFVSTLPDTFKERVREAYINAIDCVFLVAVVPTAVSVFTAFIIERKKIQLRPKQ